MIFLRYFHTQWLYSGNNEKIQDITTFITENTRNKQTEEKIKEKIREQMLEQIKQFHPEKSEKNISCTTQS